MPDPHPDPDHGDAPSAEADGGRRVRGALSRFVKKGEAQAAEPPAPEQLLWQLEEFTRRVVKRHGADSPEAARARMELSLQLGAMGRWEEANALRQESYETLRAIHGGDAVETLQAEMSLAVSLAHVGRWGDAGVHLDHAASSSEAHLGPGNEVTVLAHARLDEFTRIRPDPVT